MGKQLLLPRTGRGRARDARHPVEVIQGDFERVVLELRGEFPGREVRWQCACPGALSGLHRPRHGLRLEVPLQILLARRLRARLGPRLVRNHEVRRDSPLLDAAAQGGVIPGNRQLQPRAILQLDDGLHAALAEGLRAHDDRAPVVLERPGDDLRGRRAAGVHQHHHRVVGLRVAVLAALLGGIAPVAPACADDGEIARQEPVAHRHRLVQEPPGVVAQVQHQPAQLLAPVEGAQPVQLLAQVQVRAVLEILHLHVRDAAVEGPFHGHDADVVPDDGDVPRGVEALAHEGEQDALARGSPHLLEHRGQVQPLDALLVDAENLIARAQARPRRRGVVDGRHDDDAFALASDFDAQPPELPRGVDLHLLEDLGRHIEGVGVQRLEHALDGALHEPGVVHRLHVVVLHVGEHPREHLQVLVGVVLAIRERSGGGEQQGHRERRAPRGELAVHVKRPFPSYPDTLHPRLQPCLVGEAHQAGDQLVRPLHLGHMAKALHHLDLGMGGQVCPEVIQRLGGKQPLAPPPQEQHRHGEALEHLRCQAGARGPGIRRQGLHGGGGIELPHLAGEQQQGQGGLVEEAPGEGARLLGGLDGEGGQQRVEGLLRQGGPGGRHQPQGPDEPGHLGGQVDGHGATQGVAHHEGGLPGHLLEPGPQGVELPAHTPGPRAELRGKAMPGQIHRQHSGETPSQGEHHPGEAVGRTAQPVHEHHRGPFALPLQLVGVHGLARHGPHRRPHPPRHQHLARHLLHSTHQVHGGCSLGRKAVPPRIMASHDLRSASGGGNQPRLRVHGAPVLPNLEIKVGPLQGAGVAHGAHLVPCLEFRADLGGNIVQVGHERVIAAPKGRE
ncbi:hypothetical protein STIAU_7773 [Stigmatella aurantiaca DW4/3-1]|uniref:Uncharacterized protein n=1 Tax=Stigmatella aurantiaca (strain DW4/3-1) TaxID=378806 RepID=Q098M3_STIAD|nr:hypothetical protein STIAU_7773 [Stigmatella aurantiaca DW4/3-1]